MNSLPCGGCPYCSQAQAQRGRFEQDVDDVMPLAAVNLETFRVSVCADDGDSNWANTTSAPEETQLLLPEAPSQIGRGCSVGVP